MLDDAATVLGDVGNRAHRARTTLTQKDNNGLQLECSAPSLKTTNDRVVP